MSMIRGIKVLRYQKLWNTVHVKHDENVLITFRSFNDSVLSQRAATDSITIDDDPWELQLILSTIAAPNPTDPWKGEIFCRHGTSSFEDGGIKSEVMQLSCSQKMDLQKEQEDHLMFVCM